MNVVEKNEQIVKKEIELLQNGRPIIIFCAGVIGIVVKRHLAKMRIEIAGFCDNNEALQGQTVEGVQVYSMKQIRELYPEALIIIGSFFEKHVKSIMKQLSGNGYYDPLEGLAVVYALKMGWKEECQEGTLIKQCSEAAFRFHDDPLFLHLLGIVITEQCTLRCRDCANLMPYFSSPQRYDTFEIIESIKRLAASVHCIGRLYLLGGEPFLHPELSKIITEATKIENILSVCIVTNGTIIPAEHVLETMAANIDYVRISNYGELSRRKKELAETLKKHHILFEMHGQPDRDWWYAVNKPQKRGRTEGENSHIFQQCIFGNDCLSVMKGEFRLCAYANSGAMLGMIPKNPLDYVDILDQTKTVAEIGEMIKELRANTKYLTACDYCIGTIDAKAVRAAIQVE